MQNREKLLDCRHLMPAAPALIMFSLHKSSYHASFLNHIEYSHIWWIQNKFVCFINLLLYTIRKMYKLILLLEILEAYYATEIL